MIKTIRQFNIVRHANVRCSYSEWWRYKGPVKLRQPRVIDGRCQPERFTVCMGLSNTVRTIRGFDYRETSHFRLFRRVSGFFMHTGTQVKFVIKLIYRFADGCPARE